jgi:hypothetical protein
VPFLGVTGNSQYTADDQFAAVNGVQMLPDVVDKKTWQEDVAGRCGKRMWQEDVAGRRGKRMWTRGTKDRSTVRPPNTASKVVSIFTS